MIITRCMCFISFPTFCTKMLSQDLYSLDERVPKLKQNLFLFQHNSGSAACVYTVVGLCELAGFIKKRVLYYDPSIQHTHFSVNYAGLFCGITTGDVEYTLDRSLVYNRHTNRYTTIHTRVYQMGNLLPPAFRTENLTKIKKYRMHVLILLYLQLCSSVG